MTFEIPNRIRASMLARGIDPDEAKQAAVEALERDEPDPDPANWRAQLPEADVPPEFAQLPLATETEDAPVVGPGREPGGSAPQQGDGAASGAAPSPDFDGATIVQERDKPRLFPQLQRVAEHMRDGGWRTLGQIAYATGAPEASVSARLRDLRKPKFGGHTVEREYVEDGLHRYRLIVNAAAVMPLGFGDPAIDDEEDE